VSTAGGSAGSTAAGRRVLVAPASLKGVLSAQAAAASLATGIRRAGAIAVERPVADGGEGMLEVLAGTLRGRWRAAAVHDAFGTPRGARWLELPDGGAAVEAAEAIPLDHGHLDPMVATSRGFGELLLSVGDPTRLIVGLGGVATVDGGVGMREVLDRLPAATTVACDVDAPLLDAARLFAAQKGATPAQAVLLEERLAHTVELQPYARLAGAGSAGGLGAALASLGATLVRGAPLVLDLVGFDPRGFDLVVTGEGTVDITTTRGKAPAAVLDAARGAGVRCAVFGGLVTCRLPGAEMHELSGDPRRAADDLEELGERLAISLGHA
jgi:glycerate kinase